MADIENTEGERRTSSSDSNNVGANADDDDGGPSGHSERHHQHHNHRSRSKHHSHHRHRNSRVKDKESSSPVTTADETLQDEPREAEEEVKDVEKQQIKPEQPPPVKFFALFRFATGLELFMILIGVLCAIVHGILNPLMTIFLGDIINKFGPNTV